MYFLVALLGLSNATLAVVAREYKVVQLTNRDMSGSN